MIEGVVLLDGPDLALVYERLIDFDVQHRDLESAKGLITKYVEKETRKSYLELQSPDAQRIYVREYTKRHHSEKVKAFKKMAARWLEKPPDEFAGAKTRAKFSDDLTRLWTEYKEIPFDA